jgi:hypothetical protein
MNSWKEVFNPIVFYQVFCPHYIIIMYWVDNNNILIYHTNEPIIIYFNPKIDQKRVSILHKVQLTLVISNSMGPWKKFESTVVRLKRSYEDNGSVVCLTTKGRQLERNFEELKPASHVPILRTILSIFDVFVAVFSLC